MFYYPVFILKVSIYNPMGLDFGAKEYPFY